MKPLHLEEQKRSGPSERERRSAHATNRLRRWFFQGIRESNKHVEHQAAWYKVMCLTGVDYFSTLGYAPGIAFLAAGALSPLATLILVFLTLAGALPVYMKVAEESPHGQGSISMLAKLLQGWKGKILILCLLGFAATDFIITITLSAADAAAHIAQNPWALPWMHDRISMTMILLALLGGVFLIGFREAISISVILVGIYLLLNAVVVAVSSTHLMQEPVKINDWLATLTRQYESPWRMIGISVLLFPKLALGMSGFETGVAVAPLVKGRDGDNADKPLGRIANTKKLLITAAVIMSLFLITTSLITTMLIPPQHFANGGIANGRALAYLAHLYLGDSFGTVYDVSSIFILWFAGASAMTGLLNLVPRYLPKFGMAPEWTRASRPLVTFFTAVAFMVTAWFKADVDAQGGAYATGVLVLMTSAAFACTLTVWRTQRSLRFFFLSTFLVFVYTTILNCVERPEGIQIAGLFILTIFVASLVSRAMRATELRVQKVELDPAAKRFIDEAISGGTVRILAHRPDGSGYAVKESEAREVHSMLGPDCKFIFLEVERTDASEFVETCLKVSGHIEDGGFQVLRCGSPAVPNAIAAILIHIRDKTNTTPHAYFGWTEGNPVLYIFKYLFLGEGETAPVTREILREIEHNPERRPAIHVA
ncbi:MAG: APC family permease [Cyanobacteria bacterium SZAS-4]|nr:APC family permease [Cyanobacteria bacterium SZAS-4]